MSLPVFGREDPERARKAKEYFANFPYNEKTVRDAISALKDSGFFYNPTFDPKTVSLDEILAPPNTRLGGVRILNLTEGPGVHHSKHDIILSNTYDVPNGEVFITIDDTAPLAGSIATYRFRKKEGGLELTHRYNHRLC